MRSLNARIRLLAGGAFMLNALRNLLLAYVFFFMVALALSRFKDGARFPAIVKLVSLHKMIETAPLGFIKTNLPTDFSGTDVSRWLLYGGAYVLSIFVGAWAEKTGDRRDKSKKKRQTILDAEAAATPDLLKKAEALKAGKLDRNQLLEIYAETKKSLEAHKKTVAFLSIDIVDSTGMKIGEEVGIAERDFHMYKEMVQRILAENHAKKAAWTPDGVMICFETPEEAVVSARSIIRALGLFNKNVKAIKRDFRIRAGINSGEIFYDEAMPMEEMTDRVIDIAGHMQKHGIVDGIAISKHSIEPLLGRFKFADAKRVVDGCPVYEWTEAAGD